LTINRKSTGSIDELRIICMGSPYTHCCRASPLLQLGFLVKIGAASRRMTLTCFECNGTLYGTGQTLLGRSRMVDYATLTMYIRRLWQSTASAWGNSVRIRNSDGENRGTDYPTVKKFRRYV